MPGCQRCGRVPRPGAQFCGSCGEPLRSLSPGGAGGVGSQLPTAPLRPKPSEATSAGDSRSSPPVVDSEPAHGDGPKPGTLLYRPAIPDVAVILLSVRGPVQGTGWLVEKRSWVLGRDDDCDSRMADEMVSRHHTRLWYEQGTWRCEDLRSSNGTFVNGSRTECATLADGDLLGIGRSLLVFTTVRCRGELEAPGETATT